VSDVELPTFFELWHPTCTATDDGFRCDVDVTAAEFRELNEGTPDLIDAFARGLGLPESSREWSIRPFLSPYYAHDLWPEQVPLSPAASSSGDWRDRFGVAWRVSMNLTEVPPFRYGGLGPYDVSAIDTTWQDRRVLIGSEDREHEVVVLIDGGEPGDWSFLDEYVNRDQVEVAEVPGAFLPLHRVTVRLGRVRPQEVMGNLAAILEVCSLKLLSTHHSLTESYHLPWPERVPW